MAGDDYDYVRTNEGGRWDANDVQENDRDEEGGGVCGCIATILVVLVLLAVAAAIWFLSGP